MVRPCAVAGMFYPSNPKDLHAEIAQYLRAGRPPQRALGVVVPHAGIRYSGRVAGAVYASLDLHRKAGAAGECRFIILCPSHTGLGPAASIMVEGPWETPDGAVHIDHDLALRILAHSRFLQADALAHRFEHAIEVQLPFLQQLTSAFQFVPICLRERSYALCEDVAAGIAAAVASFTEGPVLIIASSDMSHDEPQAEATRLDHCAIERMLALDPRGLYDVVLQHGISMCGLIPTTTALLACNSLGATRAELVHYMTSGDINGDYQHVVGYAGVIIQ